MDDFVNLQVFTLLICSLLSACPQIVFSFITKENCNEGDTVGHLNKINLSTAIIYISMALLGSLIWLISALLYKDKPRTALVTINEQSDKRSGFFDFSFARNPFLQDDNNIDNPLHKSEKN